MAGKDKLSWINTRWALLDRVLGALPAVITTIGGVVVTYFTDAFAAYAPASYFFGGVIGLLAWVGISAAWSFRQQTQLTNRRFEALREPKSQINPLDQVFERKRIWINDLMIPGRITLKDKTFIDCEIYGPAVIAFFGDGTIHASEFSDCDLVLAKNPSTIKNALGFTKCNFNRCRFVDLTIIGDQSLYEALVKDVGTQGNWITYTPHEPPAWNKN